MKSMMYGDKNKMMYGGKAKMMGGGRAMYNQGSYISIQDMERHCSSHTVRDNAKGSGSSKKSNKISAK